MPEVAIRYPAMIAMLSFRKQLSTNWVAGCAVLLVVLSVPSLAADRTHRDSSSRTGSAQNMQFIPMTRSERFSHYLVSITDFQSVLRAAASAGLNQARGTPKEWRGGAEGYGKRVGNAYAEHAIRQTLQYGVSAALHEDNRYFVSGETGFWKRSKYAIASAFVARHDNGDRAFSFSRMGSTAGAAFISRAWQPRSTTTTGDGAVSFGITIGSDIGLNLLREFWPAFGVHF